MNFGSPSKPSCSKYVLPMIGTYFGELDSILSDINLNMSGHWSNSVRIQTIQHIMLGEVIQIAHLKVDFHGTKAGILQAGCTEPQNVVIPIHDFFSRRNRPSSTVHPLHRVANIPPGANEITHVTGQQPARGLCGHANNAVTPDTKLGHTALQCSNIM